MEKDKSWLPSGFLSAMEALLGDEYKSFVDSYDEEYMRGLRCNTLKISPKDFENKVSYVTDKVPWTHNGFYSSEDDQPAKHPYYYAGLYYIQEPSAMLPASLLPVRPGDKVLDLCAAPGGKTTELGSKLKGRGLLMCNDISASRAKALLKNVELFGIKNAVVTSEDPKQLAGRFEGYFDKILVDAPCSGEGMFRKVHSITKNWMQYGSGYYADIQREILPAAVKMLKPGGYMIFSTCTFSVKEDEESLRFISESFPEMELVPAVDFSDERFAGFKRGGLGFDEAIRIYPHRCKGEGHFTALLRKKDTEDDAEDRNRSFPTAEDNENFAADDETAVNRYDASVRKKYKALNEETFAFFESLGMKIELNRLRVKDDRVFLLPEDMPEVNGLRVLRTGLFLGEIKQGRFEPSQALALALKMKEYKNVLNLKIDDPRVVRYLKCESIDVEEDEAQNGLCLVCTDGYPLGWAKIDRGRLKNKYLPSWRMM
jgi:NOL1/NOP2/sun family putative RNA methylase